MKTLKLRSQLCFQADLPKPSEFGGGAVLVYDKKLHKKYDTWISQFCRSISVTAGEKLKSWKNFEELLIEFQKQSIGIPKKDLRVVAFGGGSVGDACGFLAAIFKRGIGLVQIPSTWLSAVDSAHGGKNGLNLGGVKNQVGTFYAAQKVFLVKSVLESQPDRLQKEALGEIIKMSLIDNKLKSKLEKTSDENIWPLLKDVIQSKMNVVDSDPYENFGKRKFLNLGHTMGHVLESSLGLSHGEAIAQGLVFAAELSRQQGLLSSEKHQAIGDFLKKYKIKNRFSKPFLKKKMARELILQDKKNTNTREVSFVLLHDFGKPVLKNVSLDDVDRSLRRLKWTE